MTARANKDLQLTRGGCWARKCDGDVLEKIMRLPPRNFVSWVSRPLVRAVGGVAGRGKGAGEESEGLGDEERKAGIRIPVSGCEKTHRHMHGER